MNEYPKIGQTYRWNRNRSRNVTIKLTEIDNKFGIYTLLEMDGDSSQNFIFLHEDDFFRRLKKGHYKGIN